MSHAHAFSCIRTFNSLYFDLLLLMLFWLSLSPPPPPPSLSLSLSLCVALVCSMAPKLKSTPSQNLMHFGESSSSDPTPYYVQFHDDETRNDFLENFYRWGIHSKCHVILLDFSDTDLPTVIHSRGWESFCDILGHLSLCDHTRVLLQYAWNQYFSTSFLLSSSRYAHRSYSRDCLWSTTHS